MAQHHSDGFSSESTGFSAIGGPLISGVAGLISTGIDSAVSANQNRLNRKLQREQAELDRQFNAQEAQRARDFQEYLYQTYQSPEALRNQYVAAGLNPDLMMHGSFASPVSSSPTASHSGSSPGSSISSNIASGLSSTMQAVMSLFEGAQRMKQESMTGAVTRANISVDTRKKKGETNIGNAELYDSAPEGSGTATVLRNMTFENVRVEHEQAHEALLMSRGARALQSLTIEQQRMFNQQYPAQQQLSIALQAAQVQYTVQMARTELTKQRLNITQARKMLSEVSLIHEQIKDLAGKNKLFDELYNSLVASELSRLQASSAEDTNRVVWATENPNLEKTLDFNLGLLEQAAREQGLDWHVFDKVVSLLKPTTEALVIGSLSRGRGTKGTSAPRMTPAGSIPYSPPNNSVSGSLRRRDVRY